MGPELAIFAGILLLLGNAFFVGAEFGLVSVRRSAIESGAARGSKRAIITLKALENISVLLAGAQLGITLCSLGLGALAEPAIAHYLEEPLHALHVSEVWLHPISFVIALVVTVFLHVVIGEMVPKNIALAKPERAALLLAPPLVFIVRLLRPIVSSLNAIAGGILQFFHVQAQDEIGSTYTRDEMADLVKESRREGLLTEDNEQLLSGALSFDTRAVGDIVIPVESLATVTKKITLEELEALSTRTGFSRFPVLDRKKRMCGYVHIKDAIQAENNGRNEALKSRYIRKLVSVKSSQSIRMTLKIMQRSGAHIAVVTRGKTTLGIVTLDDVLEELVGEM